MSTKIYPIARRNDLVVQHIKDEILVYDLKINKAFCLNKTSALVWQECDGSKDVLEISRVIKNKSKTSLTEDLILFAIDGLKKENLFENNLEIKTGYEGLSRREAVKIVGFASVALLPLISFLVAPTAANAASAGICTDPLGTSCTTNADCISANVGNTCTNNCCTANGGLPIDGNVCIPSPTNVCPVTPPGCDPIFGC